ncbi:MAG: polysaccharide lyase family protein [Bacteroidales bacterium]|nr:polysaccharide lyase family protein [Bacteroidales bacterium]
MKTYQTILSVAVLIGLTSILPTHTYSQDHNNLTTIWEIGTQDHNSQEFSLAPDGYNQYQSDGLFIVGQSDPKKDWPYVHPGPNDRWAGSLSHSFTIVFALEQAVLRDSIRLQIHFTDTHGSTPPTLEISLNGSVVESKLPAGGGDASIKGTPSAGKPWTLEVPFPSELLRKGVNHLSLTTKSGSWFLYDALCLLGPQGIKTEPVKEGILITNTKSINALYQINGSDYQDVVISLLNTGKPFQSQILVNGQTALATLLREGKQQVTVPIQAVTEEKAVQVSICNEELSLANQEIWVKPVRKMTVYILPHSHTDIGYTEIQTAIEDKQVKNLVTGMEYARQTASYPEGARFVWNVEVGWAADLYLERMDEQAHARLLEAMKSGQVSLNAMYLNELTGLCRPEELFRLFRFSTQMEQWSGQKIDAAMISDVPGYTWGTITAMAQAGVRYFSVAPNYFDRIGDILVQWENKPFYWISPSGQEKVLVWIPLKGYALSHMIKALTPDWVNDYANQLESMQYPFDIAHIRWSGHGDNATPDSSICGFVRDWNRRYDWPKFIISSTSEAFRAFEDRYGDQLPEVRGDWTPYWEDGAGSSALETAMNRNSADQLTQAEMIWALKNPTGYPVSEFEEAWNKVLLYSEHTWGAWCSITDPENQMTKEQWTIKKSYADEASNRSNNLLANALQLNSSLDEGKQPVRKSAASKKRLEFEVLNTLNYSRSGMIFLNPEESSLGDRVVDLNGKTIQSQRLSTGELAILCPAVEPFGQFRFFLTKGRSTNEGFVEVGGNKISNNLIECELNPNTGDIIRITQLATGENLVDNSEGQAVNQYLYFEGKDNQNVKTSGQAEIRIIEPGPLVGILEIRSTAPGCHQLIRQIRLDHQADYLVLTNTVDKKRAPMPERIGDRSLAQNQNKESVNFAFPFQVPDGIMRLDLPLGIMIPWIDQIPSACKNWFSVGRWADISNNELGISWITLDAPLLQVGELSANLVGSQSNPDVWRKEVKPTQKLFSWVMNNHWGTNYRQYQEGPVSFRYALRPHDGYKPVETTELAISLSQPLLVSQSPGSELTAPFQLEGDAVVLISLKPADSGEGIHVRLYNPGKTAARFTLRPNKGTLWHSDTGERKLRTVPHDMVLEPMGVVSLLIE